MDFHLKSIMDEKKHLIVTATLKKKTENYYRFVFKTELSNGYIYLHHDVKPLPGQVIINLKPKERKPR